MKNFKKLTALLLALVMVFALSVSAFAATTVVTAQDESVLKLESTGNTVSYMATTVDGGEKDGVIYPSTTTYTYSIKTANDSATITATVGSAASYIKVNGTKLTGNTFTLNKNTHNTVVAYTARNKEVRSFDITVVDATSVNVTIEINCVNAKTFANNNPNSAAAAAYGTLKTHIGFNDSGKMTSAVSLNLPAGSTAMDALYALKGLKGFVITGTGSATGTGTTPVVTYVSAIDGLGEKMCGSWSGWCFVSTMPNATYEMPPVGAASYSLTEGEHITWVYTCNFSDIGTAING
jgi:hypothetical protein